MSLCGFLSLSRSAIEALLAGGVPQTPIAIVSLALQFVSQRQHLNIRSTQHGQVTRLSGKSRDELDAVRLGRAQGGEGEEGSLNAGAGGGIADLGDDVWEDVELLGLGDENADRGVVLDQWTRVEDETVDGLGGGRLGCGVGGVGRGGRRGSHGESCGLRSAGLGCEGRAELGAVAQCYLVEPSAMSMGESLFFSSHRLAVRVMICLGHGNVGLVAQRCENAKKFRGR